MEVILKQDLKGLGHKNDIINVKPGYGNHYLISKGFAIVANEPNKKVALENARQAAHKIARLKQAAEALVTQISQLTIEVKAKAGEKRKIFGSITTAHLADALKSQGFVVDRKDIRFDKPIKELGSHQATITLYKDVIHTLQFKVVAAS